MSVLTVYLYIYSQKHSGWCPCAWGAVWRCLSCPARLPGSGGRGSWCQWTTVGGTVKDDECYCLDTFILGLTPSWSRASSTLVALPCFTAVLTIRIGRTISIGNRSINICRLQSCDHLSLAQASGFSSILRSKLQIKTEVSCSTHCHCHCPLDKVYIVSFRLHLIFAGR